MGSPEPAPAPSSTSNDEDDHFARMLAHRQNAMSERLKEVEARIERNNADLSSSKSS
jgi:hypothetical protein